MQQAELLLPEGVPEIGYVDVVVDVSSMLTPLTYFYDPLSAEVPIFGGRYAVPLNSRNEQGWVVDISPPAPPQPTRLRPLGRQISVGPPPVVVEVCIAAAKLWSCSPAPFLKAASPKRNIRPIDLDWAAIPRPEGSDGVAEAMFGRGGSQIWEAPNYDEIGWINSAFVHYRAHNRSVIVAMPNESRISVLHSELRKLGVPVLEYPRDYLAIAHGRHSAVILGARSALLAPSVGVGAIVVFDSVDPSMREQAYPHWEAWRLAELRAGVEGCELLLVGAAPAVETLNSSLVVRHPELSRYRGGWSRIETVSMVEELDSDPLSRIGRYRDLGRRISSESVATPDFDLVVVHNAKGFSSQLLCAKCGSLQRCEACNGVVSAVGERPLETVLSRVESLRRKVVPARLTCGTCGLQRPVVCQVCGSQRIRPISSGVDRLGPTVEGILGEKVAVVAKGSEPTTEDQIRVVVGTEAALLRSITSSVVVFLEFDRWVHSVSVDRLQRSLYQIARASKSVSMAAGVVYLQMRDGSDLLYEAMRDRNLRQLYRTELDQRMSLGLPPYRYFARVTGRRVAEMHELSEVLAADLPHELFDIDEKTTLISAASETELAEVVLLTAARVSSLKYEMFPRNL